MLEGLSLVIDRSALLRVIPWPDKGTVSNYISRFRSSLIPKLKLGDGYLIFDRYCTLSPKDIAIKKRETENSRVTNYHYCSHFHHKKFHLRSQGTRNNL